MPGANVAIIGVGCRLGGARTADELRQRLDDPPSPFAPLPPDRWDPHAFGPPPHARLIDDYDIDFRVFRIPPAQLAKMHRMERAGLGAMRDALVDAGLEQPGAWSERTRVHMAATTLGFDPAVDHLARVRLAETQAALRAAAGAALPTAAVAAALRALDEAAPPISVDSLMTTAAMTAGRLANAFDLGGGHFAHDAGAASSLAALSAAIASLEGHECDVAVVGALSPLLAATIVQAYAKRHLLAGGDRLDGATAGTLLGEGAVALVLQREADARAEVRRIRAVVRGVATASLGRRGVAVGAETAMVRAARNALSSAHFAAGSIDHVECQGPGLGVVSEAEERALATTYGGARPPAPKSCVPAFGFLGAATGLVGVAAAALRLERGEVRRAAVSAPGFGSVVYHLVLARGDDRPARVSSTRVVPSSDRRVAIVGIGAVMPGAPDATQLWRGLLDGLDAIGHIPRERWDAEALLEAATRGVPGAVRSTLAALLPAIEADAARLRLPPVAAKRIDRAVVLTVDACTQALEDAGYRAGLWDPKRVGVFVGHLPLRDGEFQAERRALAARARATVERVLVEAGIERTTIERVLPAFFEALTRELPPLSEETLENLSSLACATRVATIYDFRGGAEVVDGACASSLVALHLAIGALARGELDAAVVGASAYNLFPEYYVALATLGALATGGSRPFDIDADGFVPAEGAGAVVLRRVDDAARDHERSYAVVVGSACSSDGRGTALLAPNTRGQQRALDRAYRVAQVAPASVDLVEAHGTGTRAGDAVELETYSAIFAERRSEQPIVVSSVKSNLGHLSSAAGMAGLIKTALALHHRVLPPMRHSGRIHPDHQALRDGLLTVAAAAQPWPDPPAGARRRAGVSAFGLGGINAHVVLEEHVPSERRAPRPAPPSPPMERRAQRLRVELVPVAHPAAPAHARTGTLLLLGDPAGRRVEAIAHALESAGCSVLSWNPPSTASVVEMAERIAALDAPGLVGAVDAVDLEEPGGHDSAEAALSATRRAVATSRALWPRWERLAPGDGVYLALTAMGGGLGLVAGREVASGGALTGFVKGLKQERPTLFARAIDFDRQEEPSFIADAVVAELSAGGDRLEVGYFTRRRLVPTLRTAPLLSGRAPVLPIEASSVILFSGGGRGVVFECARALADEGAICVVSGRTTLPRRDEPWLELDDAAFEELRRREMVERRRRDPSLTPTRFAREWDALARARQLHRNLAVAGSALEYLVADVADAASCAELVADVRRRYGRIDGVVHGAMIEQSRSLVDKPPEIIDATVRTKVAGLCNLLAETRNDPLRFFVSFGSIAGRLGNRGQADYCAANDAMAKLLARAAQDRPSTRCVTIDWTAWAEVGAAADPRTAALLKKAGVESIAPAEGRRWFLDEILYGAHADHEVVICPERQVQAWPFAAHVRDDAAAPPTEIDDRGQPLFAGDWPLCDAVLQADSPGRIIVERTFDGRRDRFFAHHKLDGTAVLPGAFAVEILAEAALLGAPGLDVREVRRFTIDAPLKLPAGASQLLRSEARILERSAASCVLDVQTAVDLSLGGAVLQRDRPHYRATIVLGAERTAARAAVPPPPMRAVGARRPSRFDSLDKPVTLGPPFRNVDWVERSARGVVGEVRAPREDELFAFTTAPTFAVAPLLLDAAFQVASNWDALAPDAWVAIPLGFQTLRIDGRRGTAASVRVEAAVVEETERDVFYDVTAMVGATRLFAIERLQLRRIEKVGS